MKRTIWFVTARLAALLSAGSVMLFGVGAKKVDACFQGCNKACVFVPPSSVECSANCMGGHPGFMDCDQNTCALTGAFCC